jgi:hypothetical protein
MAELKEVAAFLLGEGPLDGLWFGESAQDKPRTGFWWRDHLRAALSHPTPVQGEALPVVAYVVEGGYVTMGCYANPGERVLTDHAQATAEITHRDQKLLLVQHQYDVMKAFNQAAAMEIDSLRTQLSDTTGQVGKLRDGLKHALAASVNAQMVIVKELPAHNWIPGLEKDIEAARAALNSTALDTPHTQG